MENRPNLKDLQAIREQAVFADLSAWSRITFHGPDWQKFLQGLLTNDIAGLKPGQGCRTCLLTPKGRMLALFDLYHLESGGLAIAPPKAGQNILAELKKKIILSESTMEDVRDKAALFYLAGPKAASALREVLGAGPSADPYAAKVVAWRGATVQILQTSSLGGGFWVVCPSNQADSFRSELKSKHVQPVDWAAIDAIRIQRGEPLFGVDLDDQTLPLEAGLESAISFTKGCYMGQETVTRMRTMGHANRKLAALELDAALCPEPGAAVLSDGREIGTITSAARVSERSVSALAMLKLDQGRAPDTIQVRTGSGRIDGLVISLPVST